MYNSVIQVMHKLRRLIWGGDVVEGQVVVCVYVLQLQQLI